MNWKLLPYGTDGWTEKIRFVDRIVASRPNAPYLFNDILILVASTRMKRMYGRLFLDALHRLHNTNALVQPDILTIHQFLEKLSRKGSIPSVVNESSKLLLLEGIVKEHLVRNNLFQQDPRLLAPSLSSALAGMITQLSAAGVTPEDLLTKIKEEDFFHKPQVKLLLDVYFQYRDVLSNKHRTDPEGMHAFLLAAFDPSWFAGYQEIIIDGFYDAQKSEHDILLKIAALNRCTCFVEAPARENINSTDNAHPIRIIKDFLSGTNGLSACDETTASPDNHIIASVLFSNKPRAEMTQKLPALSSFTKKINLLSAVNTREEISLIAGMIKKSIRGGAAADSILVVFPALDEYAPLVEEIFSDYGIPYNRALGRQLSASPVATSIISLLNACQEDFSGASLLKIFSSPFLKFSDQPQLTPSLDRFMRHHRILGGRNRLQAALRYHTSNENGIDILGESLHDLFDVLGPFNTPESVPLLAWMNRFNDLLAWSGLSANVKNMHGPLNINLQALRKLNETIASLTEAARLFPEYNYTFQEWLFLLKKTFMQTRFQVPPEDESGVQILGLQESAALPWSEIYFGGLTDAAFPQHLPQNIFLPESTLEALGASTIERQRLLAAYHFYRILLSADTVTLTWPENKGDKPVIPSPFLEELTPLKIAGVLNRNIEKTAGIQSPLSLEKSGSLQELAKAVGIAGNIQFNNDTNSLAEWLADLSGEKPEFSSPLAAITSALNSQRSSPAETVPVQRRQEFRVTELDDYLACPYDYYVKHILGIEPLETVTEDISPRDRGSKIHALLHKFYLSWNIPITKQNRPEAEIILKKLSESAFAREADSMRNRREKMEFQTRIMKRFLDAEEEFWTHGMRPVYLERTIEAFMLTLADGRNVVLSGKIDRIDVDDRGNYIIVDYKTGKYPLPKMGLEQDLFQLPIYSIMAQSALVIGNPELKKSVGLAYYDLAGKNSADARDVVLYDGDILPEQPSSKPRAAKKHADEYKTILDKSIEKAVQAVEGILANDFRPQPKEESKCRYCRNELLCGKKENDR